MWHDLQTMIWKEWKELFTSRSTGRGTLLSTLIILFVLGVFMPLQVGEGWFTQPLTVVIWAWMPIFLTLGMVTDSFAGERERHTLETLLATRLPDLAILLGKILSAVLYGWGVAILSLLLAALTLNLSLKGGPYFYTPEFFAAAVGFSLLNTVLFAALGVLALLRAATARQAYQRLSLILLGFYFLPFIIQFLLTSLRARILEALMGLDWRGMMLILGGVLVMLDVGVLGVCVRRFQRSRLLLD